MTVCDGVAMVTVISDGDSYSYSVNADGDGESDIKYSDINSDSDLVIGEVVGEVTGANYSAVGGFCLSCFRRIFASKTAAASPSSPPRAKNGGFMRFFMRILGLQPRRNLLHLTPLFNHCEFFTGGL